MLGRALMLLAVGGSLAVTPAVSAPGTCTRAEFEAAVGDAAQALRDLNQKMKPTFQAKLRELRTKRGWSHDQFLAEAAPIVQDAKISSFDDQSAAFLARIEQLGAEGSAASEPDCSRLSEVRQAMKDLVDVQTAKWAYMFDKVQGELAR